MTKVTLIQITKATVLTGIGPDHITLHTILPCPLTPEANPEQTPLQLDFKATKGTGIAYVRNTLNIEPEIITIHEDRFI